MAKNKGKYGKAVETSVPEGDEFVEGVGRVAGAAQKHKKVLIALGALIAAGAIGWAIWNWQQARKERAATTEYTEALKVQAAMVVEEGEDPPEAAAEGLDPPMHFTSSEDRRAQALQAVARVRGEYGSLGVARMARFDEANLKLEAGDYAAAAEMYRSFKVGSAPTLLAVAARENVGYALEAKAFAEKDAAARQAGLEEALKAFENMQPDEKGRRRDYALYHQGRILAELGRTDEAVERFKKVLVDFPDTPLKMTVENRLDSLEK